MTRDDTRYFAEPLRSEDSWRVRNTFDGQNEAFRVSRAEAEEIAARLNAEHEARLQKAEPTP